MLQSFLKLLYPFIGNRAKMYQYIGVWISFALIQAFVFSWIVPIPFWDLLADALIHAFLFGIFILLLWSITQYGNFEALTSFQRSINYFALGILSISLWLGAGYGILALFWDESTVSLVVPLLPTRGFIGLLIYHIAIQSFIAKGSQKESIQTMTEEPYPEIASEENAESVEIIERIAVKSGPKIHVVMVSDIMYLQADGDYVQIFTANGKYLKEQTMKYFELHLPSTQFVRVHRSVIVNVEMISRIELYEKQNQQLTLKNGQHIKTSPNGYKALRAALNL